MITMNVSGNLTADAIIKNINGTDVLNFTIASNRSYKTPEGQQKQEVTFINCELWNRPELSQYFFKGRGVHVSGFFKVRSYVSSDGTLRTAFNLRVGSFEMFGKNKIQSNSADLQPNPEHSNTCADEFREDVNEYPETNKPAVTEFLDDLPF